MDTSAFDNRDNKLGGEITNIVRNEREWRKCLYWFDVLLLCVMTVIKDYHRPNEFEKKAGYSEDSEEDESVIGKMPPSDSDASV